MIFLEALIGFQIWIKNVGGIKSLARLLEVFKKGVCFWIATGEDVFWFQFTFGKWIEFHDILSVGCYTLNVSFVNLLVCAFNSGARV